MGGAEKGRGDSTDLSVPKPGPPTRGAAFTQLRDFLKHDVKNVLRMEHGGNYTAALLLLVGAEALSRLTDSREEDAFVQMLHRHGLDPLVAHDVFEALRHGLVHISETKYIQVGKIYVELVVSWGAMMHLSCTKNPPRLYLNVRTMWAALQVMLTEVEKRLEADPAWATQVPKKWRWMHQSDPKARTAWEAFFDSEQASKSGETAAREEGKAETPATTRVLPMQLQIGDRCSDETGEWEVVSRPYTSPGGKSTHAHVRRAANAGESEVRRGARSSMSR